MLIYAYIHETMLQTRANKIRCVLYSTTSTHTQNKCIPFFARLPIRAAHRAQCSMHTNTPRALGIRWLRVICAQCIRWLGSQSGINIIFKRAQIIYFINLTMCECRLCVWNVVRSAMRQTVLKKSNKSVNKSMAEMMGNISLSRAFFRAKLSFWHSCELLPVFNADSMCKCWPAAANSSSNNGVAPNTARHRAPICTSPPR